MWMQHARLPGKTAVRLVRLDYALEYSVRAHMSTTGSTDIKIGNVIVEELL